MKNPSAADRSRLVVGCALVLMSACTGMVGPSSMPSGTGASTATGTGAGPGSTGGTGNTGTGSGTGTGSTGGPAGSGGSGTGSSPGTGSGGTSGSTGIGVVVSSPPPFQPAPAALRRLTRTQFRNAIRDVFGTEINPLDIEADSYDGNFAVVGNSTIVTSDSGVEQYQTVVENAVNTVFSNATKASQFVGCTPTGKSTDTCVRGYLQNLGLRAWRRPLDTTELDRLVAIATKAATDLGNVMEGARWATVALFASPNFIYRPEFGATTNGVTRYTGYEMASRLAFTLWNSLPDKTLLDQAAGGGLGTADGIRTQATRMLDLPAGREAVGEFAEEFMRLDRIAAQAKDAALYPDYNANLRAGMVRDMRGTWEAIAFDDRASILSVFSTPKVVVNTELATLYGLPTTGLTSTTFVARTLPADGPRLGILGKAGFLSQFANQKEGSPTLRGKFIRDSLMCTSIPAPPPDVNLVLVDPPADKPMTKRQRLEVHRTNPSCANCHGLMDPLGLPLENFDAVGHYRTTDHGLPIDASGEFDGQTVADARELGLVAAKSMSVARCLMRRYYTYAMGMKERDGNVDGSVLNTLASSFEASGFKLRDLVLTVVTSDAFWSVAKQP
jgi:hypothetical protein